MNIRYKGQTSETQEMPGGVGAGTIIGLNLFLVLFNNAGPPTNVETIGYQITQPCSKRQPIRKCKIKWVDDMTVAVVGGYNNIANSKSADRGYMGLCRGHI